MSLYHVDIRLPQGFALPARTVVLNWTRHAETARGNDRYGMMPRVSHLNLSDCRTIEVEIINRKVCKVVVRTELDNTRDMIFVLIPGKVWTVKTVWVNLKNDSHKTLNRSRYVN